MATKHDNGSGKTEGKREGRKEGGTREGKMKAIRVRREGEERDHLTHDSIRRGRRMFFCGWGHS